MALNNAQYEQIMRIYNERQLEGRHLAEKRRADILAKAPSLADLERQIASVSVSAGRRLLDGDETALAGLHDTLDALRQQKADLIRSLGFPADYLDIPFSCPDCKDTGYIEGMPCHCFKQACIDLLYEQSHLQSVFRQENFSMFSLEYYSKEEKDPATGIDAYSFAKNAYEKCRSFVKSFDNDYQNLFLQGKTGVGKTFLSNCIAKELLDSGHSVLYFSAFQLFDLLAKHTFGKAQNTQDLENIYSCDLLIIDDLGTELPNTFTVSQFFLCLNERILRKKPVIISTNLNLQDIAEIYSERTSSRITSSFTILRLCGSDIRIQKKLKKPCIKSV